MVRKKKNSGQYKRSFGILLVAEICIVLLCAYFLFSLVYKPSSKFKIETRVKNVKDYSIKYNEDYETVGWIRVQGTNIDYPVLYGLDYNFNAKTDDFVWTEHNYNNLNNIVYISGHNFLNLSAKPLIAESTHRRFEQLLSFTYLDFVKENKYIQYTTNGKDYLYKIFAVSYPKSAGLNVYNYWRYSDEEMKEYINKSLSESIFDFDVDVNEKDKVISLITCTRMFDSVGDREFKVDARLVRNDEKIENYDVKKNKNYDEVQEMMEAE